MSAVLEKEKKKASVSISDIIPPVAEKKEEKPPVNFSYTGRDELEEQQHMPRYNAHIAGLFLKKIQAGQTLMDFGAGTGTMSDIVRSKSQPAELFCLEVDATNIEELKNKGFQVYENIDQAPDGHFDVVYSANVLEHIEDDIAALKDLYRKLKPGGITAFWVPAFNCLWTGMDDKVAHKRRYTRKTLINAFKGAGFKIEQCFYQDSVGFFVTLAFKLMGDKDGTVETKKLVLFDKFIFPVSKILDKICHPFFGKNVFIYARKG